MSSADMVWIPAVPLPLMGWRTDRCLCGQKFRGRNRRHRYEIHYRREHQRGYDSADDAVQVCMTRAEAKAIYDEVNSDLEDATEDRL